VGFKGPFDSDYTYEIYTSADSGATWTGLANAPPANYLALSADGTKMVSAFGTQFGVGQIFTSTNSGATWITNSAPSMHWQAVASSADGATLMAASGGSIYSGSMFVSKDSGMTWITATVPYENWSSVACSADGNRLVAVVNNFSGGLIFTSLCPQPPSLSITRWNSTAIISWTLPAMDFTLQQNPDLTATNWTDVTTSPVLNLTNLQNQVMLPPTNSRSFYRLRL
jgi:hypothetical protein